MRAAPHKGRQPVIVTGGETGGGEVLRGQILHVDYDDATHDKEYALTALAEARRADAPAAVIESLVEILMKEHGWTAQTCSDAAPGSDSGEACEADALAGADPSPWVQIRETVLSGMSSLEIGRLARQLITGDETDAEVDVGTEAAKRIADLRDLQTLTTGGAGYTVADERVKALGLDPQGDSFLNDQAGERLDELPHAVEASTTFEVLLGVDGPDQWLLFECDRVEMNSEWVRQHGSAFTYEVRRVFYRHSWERSAEVELTGEHRETAEAFGRRVVPELGE